MKKIEKDKAKEYLLEIGFDDAHLPELFNNDDKSYYKITELMKNYHEAELKKLLLVDVSVDSFEPIHCQKNYETYTVTVQFRGKFDSVKSWEYLKQNFPLFRGKDIVAFSEPLTFRGLQNIGEVVYKNCG